MEQTPNFNITSFFRFVNKRAIYRLVMISLAHAHVTDFPVVNVHLDILMNYRLLEFGSINSVFEIRLWNFNTGQKTSKLEYIYRFY